jgi:glyoxylase-like metal-dependent hydrolase (beta-lactamase superfamily II)
MKIYPVVVGSLSTNCYIVASDQKNAFVIDPGDDAPRILAVINKNGLSARFIVDTHGHYDHIRANAALRMPVHAYESEAEMIGDPKKNLSASIFGSFEPVSVERRLKNGDEVRLDELTFRVIHTPGHTMGSLCLLGHGVLFSGDTLFKNGIGRTDFPGASPEAMDRSLGVLARLDPATIVYPGHGPETTIGRELSA